MMDAFATIMDRWGTVLNGDGELAERNKSIYSSLEGRTAISLEVEGQNPYRVDVRGGTFTVQRGSAERPLLTWKLPLALLKEVMLGKQRLIYGLLDPRGTLAFDTPNFTHWNGATIIEILFLACEMGEKDAHISQLIKGLVDG
jgi:hypothetical protein